ncbi:MAG: biopolymer transporter ExbD [Candidatus Melainabacteria bacterium]|nr:biopolymer transporter ExbD [Candidatus Melainabacteria bacterium]
MRKRLSSYKDGSGHEETHINLTPLIDVVFVVLIMFIIIAPMLELDRVQLASAAQRDSKEVTVVQENSPLAIHVHEDNSVWFNNRRVMEKELIQLLKQAKKAYPQKVPQLFHDKKAHFGTYQTVKNAVEIAGFEQLDVILEPG